MEEIKYFAIYCDNSCEVHFRSDTDESARIVLSPCGSEFVYRTVSEAGIVKSSLKYRTAYALSMFSKSLRTILKERNRLCYDRPFISTVLVENEHDFWHTPEDLSEARWDATGYNLELRNPIEVDHQNAQYLWRSTCKYSEARLSFNRVQFFVKYPVRVPTNKDDEFELKCDLMHQKRYTNSKYIYKYTWNEQEFSVHHLPPLWESLHAKMLELIGRLDAPGAAQAEPSASSSDLSKQDICVRLPEPMPLSCSSTHLHRFDSIETASEPSVVFIDHTWYRLFYKQRKSMEISCWSVNEAPRPDLVAPAATKPIHNYLVLDSSTGRYYTCYSLNTKTNEIEEAKICVENIPSFKTNLKKVLGYANILLKRLNSIKFISNYATCYVNKKVEDLEVDGQASGMSTAADTRLRQSIAASPSTSEINNVSSLSSTAYGDQIQQQFVIEDVGHFKYFKANKILINFVDKVKLYMDSYSLDMFLKGFSDKATCSLFLKDGSQHEISLSEIESLDNTYLLRYLNFLEQWLKWLLDNKTIAMKSKSAVQQAEPNEEYNYEKIQAQLNQLKFLNYKMSLNWKNDQEAEEEEEAQECQNDQETNLPIFDGTIGISAQAAINNILRENQKLRERISKN